MTRPGAFNRFGTSPEIIRLAVMVDVRFPISLCCLQKRLHGRGVDFSHETARPRWRRFGPAFTVEVRKPRVEGKTSSCRRRRLDEMFMKINGERLRL